MRGFLVHLDESDHEALTKAAAESGLKKSEIVRLALREKFYPALPRVPLKKKASRPASPDRRIS